MSRPPSPRHSGSLITPTPLPQPLALHDADRDSDELPVEVHRGPRPLPKNLPHALPPRSSSDDDAPTRIAPDVLGGDAPSSLSPRLVAPNQLDDDAMTTIAGDSGMFPHVGADPPRTPPRLPTPPPLTPPAPAVGSPSAPPPPPPPKRLALSADAARAVINRRLPPEPPPSRLKAQPSFFEQETRLVMGTPAADVMLDDDDDDLATNPGHEIDEDAFTPPPRTEFPEEPTNPRSADDSRATDRDLSASRPAIRDTADDLSVHQAFDRSFSGTIDALDPDGSAIDTPLTLFADLPEEALLELSRRMVIRNFQPGELVIREGDPGDACFVVALGEVRVLKRNPIDPQGDLVEVARLGQGALFGEFALLADRRRHATVQAVGSCDLYEIPRRLLRELAASYPEVGPLLENFYRERLLATLLATAPFFKPLPEERRADLLSRFKPMRAESGERIIREGERAGGLYLIVLGSVEIIKRVSDKRMVLLATLGEGAYFGEMSLLKGGVANASVTATGPTELAVMPPRDFYEIVSAHPLLWDEVRREANRRQLEMNQIVTGETNVV